MIHATLIPDALRRSRSLHHFPGRPGLTVAGVIEELGGDPGAERWLAIRGGARCSLDQELGLEDDVVIARYPSGFLGFIIFVVISSLISFGISYLISALIGVPGAPSSPAPEGATYGWGGIRNTRTQGTQIPVVYGLHRVGGQVLTLYRRNTDADSTEELLFMLIGLSVGQLDRIGNYQDDQDALSSSAEFYDPFTEYAASSDLEDADGYELGPLTESDGTDPSTIEVIPTGGAIGARVFGGPLTDRGFVKWIDTIGLGHNNVSVEAKVVTASGSGRELNMVINCDDYNNWHGLRIKDGTSNQLELAKAVSYTDTVIRTYTVAGGVVGKRIKLEREGNTLRVYVDDVLQTPTETADAALNDTGVGWLVKPWGGNQVHTFDDYRVTTVKRLPDDMHINGNDANTYRQVTAWLRMGRPYNVSLPSGSGFEEVVQGYKVGLPIDDAWTRYKMRDEVDAYQLVINFPRGLFAQDEGIVNGNVTVEVQYRPDGLSNFADIPGSPFSFTHAKTVNFSRTIFSPTGLTGTAQEIRYRRTTTPRWKTNPLYNDATELGSVNEVLRDTDQSYDGIALIALRIEANEQLQGATPVVTNLVRGVPVPTWDGSSGGSSSPELVYAYSRNPAWIALNILLDKDYGLGNWVELGEVDLDSWYRWADWCDDLLEYAEAFDEPLFQTEDTEAVTAGSFSVILDTDAAAAEFIVTDAVRVQIERINQVVGKTSLGGGRWELDLLYPVGGNYAANWTLSKFELGPAITDTRAHYDGVFDSELSAWEALLRVCRSARAMPIKEGSQWRVRFEDEDDPVQTISDANVVKDTLEISYAGSGDVPDIMEAQFLNEALDYDQDVALAAGFPIEDQRRVPKRQTINLYGITSARQARREANYRLRATKLLQKRIKFAVTLDGLATQAGDVIRVALTMPGWTVWAGRCRGTTAELIIDHDVLLPDTAPVVAIVRNEDDRAGTEYNVTTPPGEYPAGSIIATDASPAERLQGDATIVLYTAARKPTLWRVTRVSIRDDLTAEVEAIQYDPDAYILPGMPPGPQPPGACKEPGFYYIDIDSAFCPEPDFCDIPNTVCCFEGSCEVTLTGDGADCVEIVEVIGGRVIIRVDPGCEGDEVCIRVECWGSWIGCSGPPDGCSGPSGDCDDPLFNWCPCTAEFCSKITEFCDDICVQAFGAGFPGGLGAPVPPAPEFS